MTCVGGTVNTIPDTGGVGNIPLTRVVQIDGLRPEHARARTRTLVKIDPDDVVPEGNEFDNTAQATTSVKTAGDGGQNSVQPADDRQDGHRRASRRAASSPTRCAVDERGHQPGVRRRASATRCPPVPRSSRPRTTTRRALTSSAAPRPAASSPAPGRRSAARWSPPTAHRRAAPSRSRRSRPPSPVIITNTAFVDPNNTIPEGDETDNHDTDQHHRDGGGGGGFIDLTVSKCDIAVNPKPGIGAVTCARTPTSRSTAASTIIRYELTVSNARHRPRVPGRRARRAAGRHDLRLRGVTPCARDERLRSCAAQSLRSRHLHRRYARRLGEPHARRPDSRTITIVRARPAGAGRVVHEPGVHRPVQRHR